MNTADYLIPLPKWVKSSLLAKLNGYSLDAQEKKRARGVWIEGIHWIKAPDGNIMYNLRAIDLWAESEFKRHKSL